MSKRKEFGVCKICGERAKLTFEHVPPGSTFNRKAATIIRLDDFMRNDREGRYPWDLSDVRGTISQRGKGRYYLCEKCNNNTGSWYGKHYKRFTEAILLAALKMQNENIEFLGVELKDMRPLAIYKQIMTMFCDVNSPGFANEDLRNFILNKEDNSLDTDKYKIFMYVPEGDLEKQTPISALLKIGKNENLTLLVSEITSFPLGFALYEDLPEGYEPEGTDISAMAHRSYEEIANIQIPLTRLNVNTAFPADYRTKLEIIETIEKNQQWEREHAAELQELKGNRYVR